MLPIYKYLQHQNIRIPNKILLDPSEICTRVLTVTGICISFARPVYSSPSSVPMFSSHRPSYRPLQCHRSARHISEPQGEKTKRDSYERKEQRMDGRNMLFCLSLFLWTFRLLVSSFFVPFSYLGNIEKLSESRTVWLLCPPTGGA